MEDVDSLWTGLEGVPIPAVLSDLVTRAAIGANAAAVQLLGTPVEELIGADVISFIQPEERAAATSGVAALADRAVDAFQVRNRHVVGADGAAVAVDISGRRLESGSRRLALWVLAPAAPEISVGPVARPGEVVLAVTDHDWQLEYLSADARLLGTSWEGLVGTSLLGIVHPSGAADFLEAASRAVRQRIAVSIASRLRSEKHLWTARECLLMPLCEHDPPRLGVVITQIAASPDATSQETIAAHVRHTAVNGRAAHSLDTLAAMTARPGSPELSARQIEMLSRVVQGEPVEVIASALYLSPSTVRNHLTALYRKFGVHSRAGLLVELLRMSSPSDSMG